tara:strand:+ start:5453 stop:6202 length:750 start_codon:yes stop_codon:yes gene_type:complete
MKLTLEEPKILVDSVGVISELVNDVRFSVDEDKISLIAMDPANVAMIIFNLLSSSFTEYQVDKPVNIAINLDSLKAILRRTKPSDVLTITLDEEKNKLQIQLKSDSTRTFNLALIDVEEKEQKIPDLQFPLKVETTSYKFDEAIQDMDIIADSVALVADKDNFTIEATSNLNDAKTEIFGDEETKITATGTEQIKAKYSIEYLKKIIKASKLSHKVTLQFNKDYPLRADYIVKDKLSFSVVLAPRVSND